MSNPGYEAFITEINDVLEQGLDPLNEYEKDLIELSRYVDKTLDQLEAINKVIENEEVYTTAEYVHALNQIALHQMALANAGAERRYIHMCQAMYSLLKQQELI